MFSVLANRMSLRAARDSHAYVIDDLYPRWPENRESARGV